VSHFHFLDVRVFPCNHC